MTRERDIEQLLDIWFDDGPTDAADAAFDAFVARVYRQRQRPVWRLQSWRFRTMSTPIKLVAAVAALLAVIVGGAVIFGSGGTPLPVPTSPPPSLSPSPTPTPVAAASPSIDPCPSAVFPAWTDNGSARQSGGCGILSAGAQATHGFLPGSTLTVPDGWVNDTDHSLVYGLFPNTPANEAEFARSGETAQNILLTTQVANNLFVGCESAGLLPNGTAAQVIDWVVANEAFSTTEPIDVTIGGLTGRQVDVQVKPDWAGNCPVQENDPTRNWADGRFRLIVLDAPGRTPIGIVVGSRYSADSAAFVADAMPIIASFDFNLGPAPSPS